MTAMPGLSEQDANKHVGARVRERRLFLGMSQAELAVRIGVTRSSVANIERGRQGLPAVRLAVTAALLGVQITDLLPEVKVPPPPPPPHKVTMRRIWEVTCETCGTVIDKPEDRKTAKVSRRDHIADRQKADTR